MAVGSSSKTPLAVTNLRGATLADMNRGRLRGWAALGAVIVAVLAALAWPDLLAVLVLGAVALALAFAYLGATLTLKDGETEEDEDPESESREFD